MELDTLFHAIQKACLPAVWSRGVALARENGVTLDSSAPDELKLRIMLANRPVSPKVTLWPKDDDWFCDCGDRNDPCIHIAAAIVALKGGNVRKAGTETSGRTAAAARIEYRFVRSSSGLGLQRCIVHGTSEEKLRTTLVSLTGGLSSGRISSHQIAATREDYGVDHALGTDPRELIEPSSVKALLTALRDCPHVLFDGNPVRVSPTPSSMLVRLTDDGDGFILRAIRDEERSETFANGVALCGDTLRPIAELTAPARELLTLIDRKFRRDEAGLLASEIIPQFEGVIPLEITTARLPRLVQLAPRILLNLQKDGEESLGAVAHIVYGEPPLAEVREGKFVTLSATEVPARDVEAEWQLVRRLQTELHLGTENRVRFEGQAAVEFTRLASSWNPRGTGTKHFAVTGELTPRVKIDADRAFELRFESSNGQAADPTRVFQAWQRGDNNVPLLGGGWSKLPLDWLERYGARIQALLAHRDAAKHPSAPFLLEMADICEELGESYPDWLHSLRDALESHEKIPETTLPADLRATLRDYQRKGVDWLCFMREAGLGAMLADDMGLGKTLQALCAIRGRTLIISPTSVLSAWSEQIARFRPDLKYSAFHGAQRKLDPKIPVTLTTYGVLRLDEEPLGAQDWDTVILDEAQSIRNADSQVARAAHRLRASFRMTLTGTPVENRLEDLWSQFKFLNPGLLGTRTEFIERIATPISRGNAEATALLRRRTRPFILRRLKRDVAPELPPRTETLLHCELSTTERDLYDAILASTRAEVLAQLAEGRGLFSALEVLLRLRQACCHVALLPGQSAESSSKVDLLLEKLEESTAEGHRALVFSQWTSLLDLVEPRLQAAGIAFIRLDGSTNDREKVVTSFQSDAGPPVMLISLKAGGVGLTLTAADHIFILDPWWNPAAEAQAADRAHRIGQTNPVLIHRLVAKDTIEDRVIALQKHKLELAESALGGQTTLSAGGMPTREELLDLLG